MESKRDTDIFVELEERFEQIKAPEMRADWVSENGEVTWQLAGGTKDSLRQFRVEAIHAGNAVSAGSNDSLESPHRWLDYCLRNGRDLGLGSSFGYGLRGGNYWGSIHGIVAVSVLMCRMLQAHGKKPDANARLTEQARAAVRRAWFNAKMVEAKLTTYKEIQYKSGLAFNTIKRFLSGKKSRRNPYVRVGLAKAFNCPPEEVPE